MNFDRQQLETFAVVVEMRHFGRAAQALNVSRGAVSQRILALEGALGTPLIVRDGVHPTPAGEVLLKHIHALKVLEADTLQRIKPEARGWTRITIAVNADSLATWFEPVACAIATENFALELKVDDQDHTLSTLTHGQAMGCISTESTAPTGFVAEYLGAMEYQCVAAQAFSATYFSGGHSLREFLAAPAVLFNQKDALHSAFLESAFGFQVDGYPRHYFPSPVALLAAVRSSAGYGLVPCLQAQPLIDSGELVVLKPDRKISVDLYWHHWEVSPPNAAAVSEEIVRQARQALVQSAAGLSVAGRG
ncbi:ArgP/LysG family DNA-binding transcriptional regulator [Burkholderia cenocepacia]|nr:ArgP/LysG family DNA-binding transcriptional regulator [Burkholderia cenocepacia]